MPNSQNLNQPNQSNQQNTNQQNSNQNEVNKSEFLELYQLYQQTKNQDSSPTYFFDVNKFVNEVYNSIYDQSLRTSLRRRKFTKDQVQQFLEYPEKYEAAIREVSQFLYYTSQEYKNLVRYFSKMLSFDYILMPDTVNPKIYNDENKEKLLDSFYKNLQFIEDYNIKQKLQQVVDIIIREDYFFAYEKTDGENYIWQRLPSNYCRLSGMDAFETYTFEFDFTYFSKETVNIDNYDIEFQDKYKLYKTKGAEYRWQQLDSTKAICFKFDQSLIYGLPIFSGMFDELFRLEEIKELQEQNEKTNNYKLIHQKIPMDEKNGKVNSFLIEGGAAREFHNGVKRNIPKGIGLATTPMKLEGITLKNNANNIEEDIVAKNEKNLFTIAGVSQLLFNSDKSGSIGINRSLEMDASFMFSLLRQFELWFKKRLKMINNKKFRWKLWMPDITIYNRKDMIKELLNAGTYGFSKFFISASLGLGQSGLLGLNKIENELNLSDLMIPLVSSHNNGEAGRPDVDDSSISDEGAKAKDEDKNKNRAN